MKKKKKRKNYKKVFIIISIPLIIVLISIFFLVYKKVYLPKRSKISIVLNGQENITLDVFDEYQDLGAKAFFLKKDISKYIVVDNSVDTSKVGKYVITYKINYQGKKASIKRHVKVVDTVSPKITLLGDENEVIYLEDDYYDSGYEAIDNYDGDITQDVIVSGEVDSNTLGEYIVDYYVEDSSGNSAKAQRTVTVQKRPLVHHDGVAVLNYHFFYKSASEACGGHNCLHVDKFEEQLKYLHDNNYKTLTMEEFRAWMYGEIDVPTNSVLITVDDGGCGTGRNNGNHLIPLLEKYQMHATLFLITGWWSIDNYRSPWLDVESHSHNLHFEKYCDGVTRGAKMLCLSHDEVLEDLQKSIAVTGSSKAFCYPFYSYNEEAIKTVQEAGFALAFAGSARKATRNVNKYAIPRYQVLSSTSLDKFISWVY